MKSGQAYTHPGLLDTIMYVIKVQYRGTKYIKCRVKWFTKTGLFLTEGNEQINKTDLHKWSEV